MPLFAKKKKEEAGGILPNAPNWNEPASNVPVGQILNLRQKGFSQMQISDAMGQSNSGMQAGPMEPEFPVPSMEEEKLAASPEERDKIEEIAEAIIDEKWNDLLKDINKVIEWKEKTESRISKMEQAFKDIKSSFDSLHQGMLGKISEYDKNITDVGVEIKAMEKVFQNILPSLTENVAKLERIAKGASAPSSKSSVKK